MYCEGLIPAARPRRLPSAACTQENGLHAKIERCVCKSIRAEKKPRGGLCRHHA
jgi:hypothetical protein